VAASSSVGKICMFAYHTRHQDYTKEAKEEVRATLWQTKRSGMLSRAPEGRPEGNTMRLAGVVPALRGSGIGTVERKSKDGRRQSFLDIWPSAAKGYGQGLRCIAGSLKRQWRKALVNVMGRVIRSQQKRGDLRGGGASGDGATSTGSRGNDTTVYAHSMEGRRKKKGGGRKGGAVGNQRRKVKNRIADE
jgi:hypothetical protein